VKDSSPKSHSMRIEPFHVLLVCTGNTCRSPMAEGIMKHILKGMNIDSIDVSSAGTSAVDGFPPSENAVIVCRDWGIDISGHRSRLLDNRLLEEADLVLVMSPEHYRFIKSIAPSENKIHLIKSFGIDRSNLDEGVDDPIGGSLDKYGRTFLELDEIIRKILPDIIALSRNSNENN
jgi:protein-tyrosine-phosphatase